MSGSCGPSSDHNRGVPFSPVVECCGMDSVQYISFQSSKNLWEYLFYWCTAISCYEGTLIDVQWKEVQFGVGGSIKILGPRPLFEVQKSLIAIKGTCTDAVSC